MELSGPRFLGSSPLQWPPPPHPPTTHTALHRPAPDPPRACSEQPPPPRGGGFRAAQLSRVWGLRWGVPAPSLQLRGHQLSTASYTSVRPPLVRLRSAFSAFSSESALISGFGPSSHPLAGVRPRGQLILPMVSVGPLSREVVGCGLILAACRDRQGPQKCRCSPHPPAPRLDQVPCGGRVLGSW